MALLIRDIYDMENKSNGDSWVVAQIIINSIFLIDLCFRFWVYGKFLSKNCDLGPKPALNMILIRF